MIAVIATGGKQYLVHAGDTITIEKIDGEKDQQITFDNVLLLANDDGSNVQMGNPFISGKSIPATVISQGRAKKIRVVKYKRKVRYKRVHGHRQHQTKVTIGTIV